MGVKQFFLRKTIVIFLLLAAVLQAGSIMFEPGKAKLSAESYDELARLGEELDKALEADQELTVELKVINVHFSDYKKNKVLALKRADFLRKKLIKDFNLDKGRIIAVAMLEEEQTAAKEGESRIEIRTGDKLFKEYSPIEPLPEKKDSKPEEKPVDKKDEASADDKDASAEDKDDTPVEKDPDRYIIFVNLQRDSYVRTSSPNFLIAGKALEKLTIEYQGYPIPILESGAFSKEISVEPGDNQVVLKITREDGSSDDWVFNIYYHIQIEKKVTFGFFNDLGYGIPLGGMDEYKKAIFHYEAGFVTRFKPGISLFVSMGPYIGGREMEESMDYLETNAQGQVSIDHNSSIYNMFIGMGVDYRMIKKAALSPYLSLKGGTFFSSLIGAEAFTPDGYLGGDAGVDLRFNNHVNVRGGAEFIYLVKKGGMMINFYLSFWPSFM